MKQPNLFFKISTFFAGLLFLGTVGCSGKPDIALCGQYYRHLLQLQQNSHHGILAAMKTSQGKDAIINYCLSLEKSRVECSLSTGDLSAANHCETGAQGTMIDGLMERFDEFRQQ